MIRKLQIRFIRVVGFAVITLMLFLLIPMNVFNYISTSTQLRKTLNYLIEVRGSLPLETVSGETEKDRIGRLQQESHAETEVMIKAAEPNFTAESRYQLRYFLVSFDKDGNAEDYQLSHIASVDRQEAYRLGKSCLSRIFKRGYLTSKGIDYYYLVEKGTDGETVVGFLDCTREMSSLNTFRYSSFLFGLLITSILMVVIYALSKSVMQPYIDNMESQKQFITNAGHELKTPLAIISANTEVIEMLNGKNEWTDGIMSQVKRSTDLINELITLSRMSESQEIVLSDMDLSAIVTESSDSFKTVILQQGKKFEALIGENIHARGEAKLTLDLVNILLDNAAKYCDDNGNIRLELKKKGRSGALLIVQNDYRDGGDVDYSRLFQRFYREDTSHNSKKPGHGIGLAMAQTIVERMKGTIAADWKDGVISFTVTFP